MLRSLPFALTALALAACGTPDDPGPYAADDDSRLYRFDTCGQLRAYAGDVFLESLVQQRYAMLYPVDFADSPEDAAGDPAADGGDDGPSDYTGTNNQEAGVDELDFVKTDGEHIYVVQNRSLSIVKSWPVEDTELVGELDLGPDRWPIGLFLDGDRVVVFSSGYDTFGRWSGTVFVTHVDVSDRAAPVVTGERQIEGWLTTARLVDDTIYGVVNTWMPVPEAAYALLDDPGLNLPERTWDEDEDELDAKAAAARDILRPHVRALAAGMDLSELLPMQRADDGGPAEPLLSCGDVYRPGTPSRYSVLSVVQLDTDGGDLSATGLLSEGWQVYASRDNLYISQSTWWSWWGWGDLDLETRIHKFALGGTEPEYAASGEVPGWTLNQFSFSEHDGALRVATTDRDWWWGTAVQDGVEPANNVFVLEDDGAGTLGVVGEVRGIAPNEQIMSARFLGDRGYLVTFEQVDPLFTLDLSDPTDPQVVGELKIPGFSSYLHPLADDHLLAVGRTGDWDGAVEGLAVNVFDVSDFANPTLAHEHVVETGGWSGSEALWNHHAFTYHRDTLSLPAYIYGDDERFSGLLVLDATTDGLSERGRIDHEDLVGRSECLYAELYGYDESICEQSYWYASVRRSLYIEDDVFSISDYGIKVNDLNDPDTLVAEVLFRPL